MVRATCGSQLLLFSTVVYDDYGEDAGDCAEEKERM
jgi:hypothetical protein